MSRPQLLLMLLSILLIAIQTVSGYRHTIKLGIRMEGRTADSEAKRRDWVRGIVFAVNQKTRIHDLHIQVVDFVFLSTPPANLATVQAMAQGKGVDLMQAWTSRGPTDSGLSEAPGAVCTTNAAAIVKHTEPGIGWLRYDVVAHRVLKSILNSIGINASMQAATNCPCTGPPMDCVTSDSIRSFPDAILPMCTRSVLDKRFKNKGCTSKYNSAAVMSICGNGIREEGEQCDCTVYSANTAKDPRGMCRTTNAIQCTVSKVGNCKPPPPQKPSPEPNPVPLPPVNPEPAAPPADQSSPAPTSPQPEPEAPPPVHQEPQEPSSGSTSKPNNSTNNGLDIIPIAVTVVVVVIILSGLFLYFVVRRTSRRKTTTSRRTK